MKQIYIYTMDTMADWQYAYLLPLLNNVSFYKVDHDKIELKMVGADIRPIKTAGGLKIIPTALLQK